MIRSILLAVFAVSVAAAPMAAQNAPAVELPGVVTPPAGDIRPPQGSDSRQDQTITETVPLRYAKADQLAAELKKVVGKGVRLTADARTNTLIITARTGSLERIVELAQSIDRMSGRDESAADPYSEPIVRTFPLRHVDASDAARVLRQVFEDAAPDASKGEPGQAGTGSPQPDRPASGDVGVAVDARTNAVIVTAPKENVERAEQ